MSQAVITEPQSVSEQTRQAVQESLFAVAHRNYEWQRSDVLCCIRDLGLVLCGVKPAALLAYPEQAEVAGLIEYAVANQLITVDRDIVAADPDKAHRTAELWYGRSKPVTGPKLLGALFGYPRGCVDWFCAYRHFGSPRDWEPNERRFTLCRIPGEVAGMAEARSWARSLWRAFEAAYGADAVALVPITGPGDC